MVSGIAVVAVCRGIGGSGEWLGRWVCCDGVGLGCGNASG